MERSKWAHNGGLCGECGSCGGFEGDENGTNRCPNRRRKWREGVDGGRVWHDLLSVVGVFAIFRREPACSSSAIQRRSLSDYGGAVCAAQLNTGVGESRNRYRYREILFRSKASGYTYLGIDTPSRQLPFDDLAGVATATEPHISPIPGRGGDGGVRYCT